MKHMNIKIALLALTSLLASGHSMANESGLSSTNSSVGKYSYFTETADSERGGTSKLFLSPELIDTPFLLVKKCTVNGEKGKFCKYAEDPTACVPKSDVCPKKPKKSPHYKESTLDNEVI